jgi:hypothetical protein
MKTKEIIKIINRQDNWESTELVKLIKSESKKQIKITFAHIGGYELLRDGTQKDVCTTLEQVQCVLRNSDIEIDETITDPYKLVKEYGDEWAEGYDDGGGSGWIEC